MGFEAFFTENMNFVVATTTKKEFHAYIVYQAMFRSSEWVRPQYITGHVTSSFVNIA